MVQQRFVEKEGGSWILCYFLFSFPFFKKYIFQFSLISFHRNFKANDASSSSGRQTCEIWLIFFCSTDVFSDGLFVVKSRLKFFSINV